MKAECLIGIEAACIAEIEAVSVVRSYAPQEYVVRQGERVHSLPIVLSGRVKVFSDEATIQFLLYYLVAGEACIFSFAHIIEEEPMAFSAVAELESELLLLPLHKVGAWVRQYPAFSNMLLRGYQKHYKDLLHTTKQIVCYKLDERLVDYLRTRARMEKTDELKLSHQEIADDLGTSREVISRLMKRISQENIVRQVGRKIKVL